MCPVVDSMTIIQWVAVFAPATLIFVCALVALVIERSHDNARRKSRGFVGKRVSR